MRLSIRKDIRNGEILKKLINLSETTDNFRSPLGKVFVERIKKLLSESETEYSCIICKKNVALNGIVCNNCIDTYNRKINKIKSSVEQEKNITNNIELSDSSKKSKYVNNGSVRNKKQTIFYKMVGVLFLVVCVVLGYVKYKSTDQIESTCRSEQINGIENKNEISYYKNDSEKSFVNEDMDKVEESDMIQVVLSVEEAKKELSKEFSLEDENLVYYDTLEIQEMSYFAFYIVDSGGGAWDSLLVCTSDMEHIGLYDIKGNISEVSKNQFDGLNEYVIEDTMETEDTIETEDTTMYIHGTWEYVLDKYMIAMIKEKDRVKATSLTDPSYYYIDNGLSEEYRMHYVNDLRLFQEDIIASVENLDKLVETKKWDYYTIDYVITTIDPYKDDYNIAWVDVYFYLKISYSVGDMEEVGGEHYRISLREYPEGWKITWLAES